YFCARDLPLYTRDERRMAETRRMLQEWYDALGGRPAQRVWLYNSRSNPFARAVAPEFIGDIPRLFGKLVGREGGLFFDFDGRRFIWNNYYSAYAGCKSQWNPDFDVDAAIDAHWSAFYGPAAGPHLKRFHDLLTECFVKYFVPADALTVAYPPVAIDEMERCLKMAESTLRPGSVEMHRFRLLADRWPEALASQRALAAYRPPVYDVPRSDAAAKPFDLVDPCGSPTVPRHGGDLRLSWDDRALHGRFVSDFAAKGGVEKDFWQSDRIELFLSPGLKKGLKHLVAFDANGRMYSERQRLRPIPQPVEKEWRPEGAKVRAARGVNSWSLDFTIPFSVFEDGAPKPNDEWNFNFVCTKASEPQSVAGTALTGGNHHNLDMYGVLRFVGADDTAAETSVAPVPGPFGSSVKVRCAGGRWVLRAARADGPEPDVFEVRIDMASEAMSAPPELIVEWSMPQNDMHALWSMRSGGRALGIRPDWSGGFVSQMNQDLPVYALMDANDGNRLTVAADDPVNVVHFKAGVHEETCETTCRWTFFSEPVPPATNVSVRLRFDARRVFWADAIRDAAQWVSDASGAAPAKTPEAARAALYSTWYAFHQNVSAEALEKELAVAASLGMKTVIVDDGWQTDDNRRGYAFCGDWNVSTNKFPDMQAHVERVHGLGMKFMLWYGVPVVGEKSANIERLGKFALKPRGGGVVLDPRFPEVREFLIGKWESAVRDWDVDGFKLDFLCNIRGGDQAREGDGRDIADLHEAIARLLGDATGRLRAMKPDLLVEFREDYIGPAMRRYGNMMRVEDCPADMARNRRGIANLRMVCGNSAVHSDMLEWCMDEPPESAARQIINSIFGTIQYSVRLGRLPKGHLDMLRHWTRFAREHEETLQRGTFRPHRPAFGFPVIEAETSYERIIAAYEPDTVVRAGLPSKPVYLLNATGEGEMVVDLQKAPTGAILFDACGRIAGRPSPTAGLSRLRVPPGGYARLDFSPRAPRLSSDGNGTLVDGCWMWGHDSGVYDGSDGKGGLKYGIPGSEPISMAAAVERFGVPNVCVIRWGDPPDVFRPQPPTDGYLAQFGRLERFGWAIANNKDPVYAQMRSFVPGLVGKCPNMTAFDLDDFFRAHKPPTSIATDAGQRMSLPGALSYAEMKELKALAKSAPHPVDVRMTLYTKDLCAEIMPLAELADSVILWTWDGSALDGLEDKFAQYRAYLPQTPTWLGIYMWDFGGRRPLAASFMERQLDIAKRLFLAGEIRGCVFHCTPLVNKGLEAVERCREWLKECGGLRRAP
ncbi:MAG: alpha-galactosidase, partial [Kiritimatiellae bacterium]|nr:alpha-galactosidase [Kiritimatiellia bacterium]